MSDPASELEYDLRISINYHRKREFFFRCVEGFSKAVSLLALASLGFDVNWFTWSIAMLSAGFTIATIVIDCSGLAAKHKELAGRFCDILAKTPVANSIPELRTEFFKVSGDEPPSLHGLSQLCQDEQDAAEGRAVDPKRFTWGRRTAAQFGFGQRDIDFPKQSADV